MTFSMPLRGRNLKIWASGKSQKELESASNVGRRLMEKMGWENGLGLGKDNQGMVENPLWRYRRSYDCKTGFKCKEEILVNENLPHQNAFEDLLCELNSHTGEGAINTNDSVQMKIKESVPTSGKRIRYKKMARAKDIANYSIKDFKGIIGKEVTKKNLDLLCENADSSGSTSPNETNEVCVSQTCESSSEQFAVDNNLFKLQKRNSQLCVSQKRDKTLVENSTCVSMRYASKEFAEIKNSKKKITCEPSKSRITDKLNAVEYYYSDPVASTSGEYVDDEFKEWEPTEDVYVYNTETRVKKKSRKRMKNNSDNYALFSPNHCTSQSSEINGKKKKKMKEDLNNFNACNVDYNTSQCVANFDANPTLSEEIICNTKSINEIRRKENSTDKIECVSRISVTQIDTSVRISDKSSDGKKTETRKEGNMISNGCGFSEDTDKNGDYNSLTFVPQKNFFLTAEERNNIKKQLVDNPEILQQVANAFQGSNLMSIKGYGNW